MGILNHVSINSSTAFEMLSEMNLKTQNMQIIICSFGEFLLSILEILSSENLWHNLKKYEDMSSVQYVGNFSQEIRKKTTLPLSDFMHSEHLRKFKSSYSEFRTITSSISINAPNMRKYIESISLENVLKN